MAHTLLSLQNPGLPAKRNADDLNERLEDWLSRLQLLINSNLFPSGGGIPTELNGSAAPPAGGKGKPPVGEQDASDTNNSTGIREALHRRDEQVMEHLEDWLSRVQIFLLDKQKRSDAMFEVLQRSPSKLTDQKKNKPQVANSFQGQRHFGEQLSHTVSLNLDDSELDAGEDQPTCWTKMSQAGFLPSANSFTPESNWPWQRALQRIVGSTYFESCSAAVIVTNSIFTGIQVQIAASDPTAPPDDILFTIGAAYTILFTLELMMRLLAGGLSVFVQSDWAWIVLDVIVVSSSLFELILEMLLRYTPQDQDAGETNVSNGMRLIRVLRIAKITRAIRIVRLVRFVRSLRTLLYCIGRTLRAMFWSGMLLLLIIFLYGLIFTDITTEYLSGEEDQILETTVYVSHRFGSLDASMHTLYASITGGITWIETRDALASISELWGFMFEGYIAFCLFAVLNVMTGVFCQSAIESAERDHEMILQNVAHEKAKYFRAVGRLFAHLDANADGGITMKEFEQAWKDPSLISIFDALEINAGDAWALFTQLDRDGDHEVDVNEFLEGCMLLKGPARSIDVICIKKDLLALAEDMQKQAADLAAIRQKVC